MGTSLYVSSNNCEPNTKKLCMQNSFILEVKKADINIHFNIQIKERWTKKIFINSAMQVSLFCQKVNKKGFLQTLKITILILTRRFKE